MADLDKSTSTPTRPDNTPVDAVGAGATQNQQMQWVIGAINQMKTDVGHTQRRVDDLYIHVADKTHENDSTAALSKIDTKLDYNHAEIGRLLVSQGEIIKNLEQLNRAQIQQNNKLEKLDGIEDKLGKLNDIDDTVKTFLIWIKVIAAVMAVTIGGIALFFGPYMVKILEALNNLVLKQ